MSFYDDNSFVAVIIIPAIGGIVGFLLLGPFGFFLGVVIPLIIGANAESTTREKDERIAELEQKIEELEDER